MPERFPQQDAAAELQMEIRGEEVEVALLGF
jgi:hypothetical protein